MHNVKAKNMQFANDLSEIWIGEDRIAGSICQKNIYVFLKDITKIQQQKLFIHLTDNTDLFNRDIAHCVYYFKLFFHLEQKLFLIADSGRRNCKLKKEQLFKMMPIETEWSNRNIPK